MQKNPKDLKLLSTDSILKKNESLDQIKTTNVNILLNRVRSEKKNDFKKKIFFSFLMLSIITIVFTLTISN